MGAMSSARADQNGSPGCSCPADRQRHRADRAHGTTSVENVNPTAEATVTGAKRNTNRTRARKAQVERPKDGVRPRQGGDPFSVVAVRRPPNPNPERLPMSNMSYCRFWNTLLAFRDCASAMEEVLNDPDEELSEDEAKAADALLVSMVGYLGQLADFGKLSREMVYQLRYVVEVAEEHCDEE